MLGWPQANARFVSAQTTALVPETATIFGVFCCCCLFVCFSGLRACVRACVRVCVRVCVCVCVCGEHREKQVGLKFPNFRKLLSSGGHFLQLNVRKNKVHTTIIKIQGN